ncbi:DNA polymerase IV [Papillibacter cinnamivorans]|uniref:DNA polymerase IV n=1 Tax=Papillibacter cinnamivorans DSM 12816 TaxID=1122930 RepID=A0A1W1Z2G4_9FIRM|nr:DNA polymerase IV [Papillibacter cinnamivorans]SMC42645.1 DNA polymerase-4 [Papillibacter cinnamivorans DSM 12816]
MDRTILHCDMNGFFASVELLTLPELRDKPVAVCGDPESRHGIILAKNELAKSFGIKTAETIWQARKKCPALVLIPPHHSRYEEYSRRINAIYSRFTDLVEPFGIDESWLDITGTMHLFGGSGRAVADRIRKTVKSETGLTLSVGVSFNKIFAKLGSDYKKPDATTVISRENFRAIVWPLPVSALMYVGGAAEAALAGLGVGTVGQLAACDRELLRSRLGKLGVQLHEYACGEDASPVLPYGAEQEIKSVGNGITFRRNLVGRDDVRAGIALLSDTVAARLRRHSLRCRTVQVVIRDPELKTISRQKPLPLPSCLSSEIAGAALELVEASWNLSAPIRMLTVTGMNLLPESECFEQLNLFSSGGVERRRREELERAMDRIRARFGKDAVRFGAGADNDLGARERERE